MLCLEIRDSNIEKVASLKKIFFLSFAEKNVMKDITMR